LSELARLRWKCRRGTRELDTILGGFLEHGVHELTPAQLAAFDRLLDEQDDRLIDYFYARQRPRDGELHELVEIVLSHAGPGA
jgi:antitoxin CptB